MSKRFLVIRRRDNFVNAIVNSSSIKAAQNKIANIYGWTIATHYVQSIKKETKLDNYGR